MSTDAFYDAYEKGKKLAAGDHIGPIAKSAKPSEPIHRSQWKDDWHKERTFRDKGYVCSKCSFFSLETDHPLSKSFPDLGKCEKFGAHRFGTASCSMGKWDGRRRPDAYSNPDL